MTSHPRTHPTALAAVLILLSGVPATAAPPAPGAKAETPAAMAGVPWTPPAAEAALAAQVDTERLQQTVRDLVRLGPRMGGTPSGERAAAYLASAFSRAGLEPKLIDDPAHSVHWEDSWNVEIVGSAPLTTAYPYGFSPALEPIAAPLAVLNGAPGAPHAPWHGKVLFVAGEFANAYKTIAASRDRPIAILTDAPGDGKRYLDAARLSELPKVAGANLNAPTAPIAPTAPTAPIAVFGVSYEEGRRLAAAAGQTVRVALRSTVSEGRPRTVIATLAGRDASHYYLICAHGDSDSGGPGADDNGSGEAVVLELARVFAAGVRAGSLPAPKVSLRFAVWESEYASSEAYVAREGDRLRDCLGVINLDEVGTGAERDAIYFESNDVPWNGDLLHVFDRVGRDFLGRPGFWPEYTTNPSQGGTDSYAFLPKRFQGVMPGELQIPAITVYTAAWDHLAHLQQTAGWETPGTPDPKNLAIDYSRYYHSSGDTPANTTDRKPEAMVRAARAIALALLRLTAE